MKIHQHLTKNLVFLTTLILATSAQAGVNFNTTDMAYTPPAKLINLCKTVINHRINDAKQAGERVGDLDKNPQTACMTVDIELVKTGEAWIDTELNAYYLRPETKRFIDDSSEWTSEYFSEPDNQNSPLSYQFSSDAELISVSDKTVQIVREDYLFDFGAHGMPSVEFYVMDLADKKRLKLDDVLLNPAKKSELENLLKQQFTKELKIEMGLTDDEVQSHFDFWEFNITDNFYFSPKGMTFVYIPYEIAPYAMGFTALNISKAQLKGFVKDKYIHQSFDQFDDNEWSKSSHMQ